MSAQEASRGMVNKLSLIFSSQALSWLRKPEEEAAKHHSSPTYTGKETRFQLEDNWGWTDTFTSIFLTIKAFQFHKTLAQKIAESTGERYDDVKINEH